MKQIKKCFVTVLLLVTLLNIVVVPAAFAVDMDIAAPNEMTVDKSRQLHQQKKVFKALLIAAPVAIFAIAGVWAIKTTKKGASSSLGKKQKK